MGRIPQRLVVATDAHVTWRPLSPDQPNAHGRCPQHSTEQYQNGAQQIHTLLKMPQTPRRPICEWSYEKTEDQTSDDERDGKSCERAVVPHYRTHLPCQACLGKPAGPNANGGRSVPQQGAPHCIRRTNPGPSTRPRPYAQPGGGITGQPSLPSLHTCRRETQRAHRLSGMAPGGTACPPFGPACGAP